MTLTYRVTVTNSKNQWLGTVNNCTCAFFEQTHSACKHMYVVSRQTL